MAQERYGFFDSSGEDIRSYNSVDMATAFHTLASNGVANLGSCLQVTAEGSTMRTLVGYGTAMIEGYYYKLRDDGSGVQAFTHTTEAELNRIDRIILRLDFAARTISMVKLIGMAAATPEAPALTRDDETWEISMAQVLIQAGASEILSTDITDERADDTVCGLIAPESLRRANIVQLITEETADVIRFTDMELTESEQEQARENINAPSADDVKFKLYTSVDDIGLTLSTTLTLEEIFAAMPNYSVLMIVPDTGSTGNISPAASRYGVLVITRNTAYRVRAQFFPTLDHSIWTIYGSYSASWTVGTWQQIMPVTEVAATLAAASWSGTEAPYTQTVAITGMTSGKKAIVGLPATATSAQYLAAAEALLHVTAQSTNTVSIAAEGNVPAVDIPILVEIVG